MGGEVRCQPGLILKKLYASKSYLSWKWKWKWKINGIVWWQEEKSWKRKVVLIESESGDEIYGATLLRNPVPKSESESPAEPH